MRESILAVCERPESLKVLHLEHSRGRFVVTLAASVALLPGALPEAMAAQAAALIPEGMQPADQIILGLDGAAAVLRRLPFPFTASSKIDLVLGPEFEPYLVTPLTDVALSWTPTALATPPAAMTLAAAVPLDALIGQTAALTAQGLPPSAACLDLAGLDTLLATLFPADGAALCVCLLDGRADFVCRLHGAALTWRSLPAPTGSADDDTPDISAFLVREAVLTLSAMASQAPAGLSLAVVGDACAAAHANALEKALAVPSSCLAERAGWPLLPGGEPLPDAYAAAYGLALLAAKGPGTANFLRGTLTPALSRASLRRAFVMAGGSLALLVLCAVLALVAAYWRLDDALTKIQNETSAIVAAAAPELAPGLTLSQKVSVVRGRLAEMTAGRDRSGAGTGTILEVLAAIHKELGASGKVQARRIAADDARVTIDAVADDYTTVDAVKRRLSAIPVFASVEIKGAKNMPDKKQVEFQLDLRLAGGREQAP
ncbi:hypothetical protein [Desulfovibrio sp. TomC]|uniref:hypothetical protein n=1 Tax=Desulfovibrio sp. TomC TaxID=1562888 RepID=UPI0005757CC9|nr:hypothetical protein [Desulfovibrio sp. TomC]KHK01155.1 hypothetical protein NY78_3348 [Desulfovibrio sp. TomC]